MKRKLSAILLLVVLLATVGCKKCYNCQNSCRVCQDAHFYIFFQSDILSTAYFKLYTDSLISIGYSCRDTAPNKNIQVCGQPGTQINNAVFMKEDGGYTCSQQ